MPTEIVFEPDASPKHQQRTESEELETLKHGFNRELFTQQVLPFNIILEELIPLSDLK